jgi:hypothetical protein
LERRPGDRQRDAKGIFNGVLIDGRNRERRAVQRRVDVLGSIAELTTSLDKKNMSG